MPRSAASRQPSPLSSTATSLMLGLRIHRQRLPLSWQDRATTSEQATSSTCNQPTNHSADNSTNVMQTKLSNSMITESRCSALPTNTTVPKRSGWMLRLLGPAPPPRQPHTMGTATTASLSQTTGSGVTCPVSRACILASPPPAHITNHQSPVKRIAT